MYILITLNKETEVEWHNVECSALDKYNENHRGFLNRKKSSFVKMLISGKASKVNVKAEGMCPAKASCICDLANVCTGNVVVTSVEEVKEEEVKWGVPERKITVQPQLK